MNTDGNAEPGTGGVVQGVRALHHSSSRVLGGTTEVECGGRASHLHSHKSEHGGGVRVLGERTHKTDYLSHHCTKVHLKSLFNSQV